MSEETAWKENYLWEQSATDQERFYSTFSSKIQAQLLLCKYCACLFSVYNTGTCNAMQIART